MAKLGQWGGGWNPAAFNPPSYYSWRSPAPAGGGYSQQTASPAAQCYTRVDPNSGDIKSGVPSGMADGLRAKGYKRRKDECAERGPSYNTARFGGFSGLFRGGSASAASTMQIASPYAPFGTATGLSGRAIPSRRLGEETAQPPPMFSYADAVAWLASAEKLISLSPICDLFIVNRFRSFVESTPPSRQASAVWTFYPEDVQGMAEFVACTEKVKPHLIDYDWKISDHAPELIGAGIAAGLLAWALYS